MGHEINPVAERFAGTMTLMPVLGNCGTALTFTAMGDSDVIIHDERTLHVGYLPHWPWQDASYALSQHMVLVTVILTAWVLGSRRWQVTPVRGIRDAAWPSPPTRASEQAVLGVPVAALWRCIIIRTQAPVPSVQ